MTNKKPTLKAAIKKAKIIYSKNKNKKGRKMKWQTAVKKAFKSL